MSTDIEKETKSGRSENILERLASIIGGSVRATTIFGEPVEKDGITVIPVARARWGFGSSSPGGNSGENQKGGGTGGGAGVKVSPVGYVEVKDGRARFRPIYDPAMVTQIIVASGIVAALLLQAVRRLLSKSRAKSQD
jgi:uncharacterized spore protein YtfJ